MGESSASRFPMKMFMLEMTFCKIGDELEKFFGLSIMKSSSLDSLKMETKSFLPYARFAVDEQFCIHSYTWSTITPTFMERNIIS